VLACAQAAPAMSPRAQPPLSISRAAWAP
jgi:hypothetical protein